MPKPEFNTLPSSIKDHWASIAKVRYKVSSELALISRDLHGDDRNLLRSLSRWFAGSGGLEDALKRSDVLAVCLPLIDRASDEQPADTEITQAAQRGYFAIGRNVSISRRLFWLLLYPMLIGLAGIAMAAGFCFYIAPQFESMFEDFGISLPYVTTGVFQIASLVRQWWLILFSLPVLAIALLWFLNRAGRKKRANNLSWLDQRLMSNRHSAASWAWHVASLMDCGIESDESILVAGEVCGNPGLRVLGVEWTNRSNSDRNSAEAKFSENTNYQLLNAAVRFPDSPGKIALLREIARYYWERDRTVGDWWIHWLVMFSFWFVGVVVAGCVASVFLPLFAIISGLSGLT